MRSKGFLFLSGRLFAARGRERSRAVPLKKEISVSLDVAGGSREERREERRGEERGMKGERRGERREELLHKRTYYYDAS